MRQDVLMYAGFVDHDEVQKEADIESDMDFSQKLDTYDALYDEELGLENITSDDDLDLNYNVAEAIERNKRTLVEQRTMKEVNLSLLNMWLKGTRYVPTYVELKPDEEESNAYTYFSSFKRNRGLVNNRQISHHIQQSFEVM